MRVAFRIFGKVVGKVYHPLRTITHGYDSRQAFVAGKILWKSDLLCDFQGDNVVGLGSVEFQHRALINVVLVQLPGIDLSDDFD